MDITLNKAIEIIELNIREASRKMPPDVKDSLRLLVHSAKALKDARAGDFTYIDELLPGEAAEPTK